MAGEAAMLEESESADVEAARDTYASLRHYLRTLMAEVHQLSTCSRSYSC